MFNFLKDKLKNAISSLSKDVDEEADEIEVEESVEESDSKEGFSELKKEPVEEVVEEQKDEVPVVEGSAEEFREEVEKDDLVSSDEVAKSKEDVQPEVEEKAEKEVKKEVESDSVEEKEEESSSQEEPVEEPKEEKGFFAKLKDKIFTSELDEEEDESDFKEESIQEDKIEETESEHLKEEKEDIQLVVEDDADVVEEVLGPEVVKESVDKFKEEVKEEVEVPKEEPEEEKEDFQPEAEEKTEKVEEVKPEPVEEEKENVSVFEEPKEEVVEEVKESVKDGKEESKPLEEAKGFFGKLKQKIVAKKISKEKFEDLFWNLEIVLLENNVAVEVIEKIKLDLEEKLVDKPIPRGKIEDTIMSSLKKSITELFDVEKIDLFEKVKEKKPYVICFVGVNGSGKTTSIAKMAQMFKEKGLTCVLAAADTFRAAAIDQLETHGDNLGFKVIKHDYGGDAAAVAFDAIKHAEQKDVDIVLIDTAGRLHSNKNLMEELKKVIRVSKPDLTLFVGESITGNDCVEQAKQFNESVNIDGIILTKADVDEKGGAAISVSYVTKRPVLYIGLGQEYKDFKEFDSNIIMNSLGL